MKFNIKLKIFSIYMAQSGLLYYYWDGRPHLNKYLHIHLYDLYEYM